MLNFAENQEPVDIESLAQVLPKKSQKPEKEFRFSSKELNSAHANSLLPVSVQCMLQKLSPS